MGSAPIHPAHGILIGSMKTSIQILLLALLVGCASPYYPVYVNNEGDYYIAERATNETYYYGAGYYPWWISGYPPQIFSYYSPYFYPYYFSVWYPPAYSTYPYWYPPYRHHRHHRYPGHDRMVVSPMRPPVTDGGQVVAYPGLPFNRDLVNRGGKGQRVVAPPRSASAYSHSPARSSVPASRMSSSGPSGFSLPSARSGSAGRGKAGSSNLSVRHRQ